MRPISHYFVILCLALLAGTTTYFAAKSTALERNQLRQQQKGALSNGATSSPSSSVTPSISPSSSPAAVPTESTPPSSAPTQPSISLPTLSRKERLSQPIKTYTVVEGDTLYPISLQLDISLDRLARANGLVEPFPLQIGQTLAIPTVNQQSTSNLEFASDATRLNTEQQMAVSGTRAWRFDPRQTAIVEAAGYFSLQPTDDYRLTGTDAASGTATVNVTKITTDATTSLVISLKQPGIKGDQGAWVIERISAEE